MRRITVGLVLTAMLVTAAALPLGIHPGLAASGSAHPIGVRRALALCKGRQTAYHLWLRGWFIPALSTAGEIDGGLFPSRTAVPLTTVNQWDIKGHWRRYNAIFVRVFTGASFGPRTLTLHGRLNCRSAELSTDRDPFPPPRVSPTYATSRGTGAGVTTTATADGLRLSLTVPRQSYPRNALVRVTVRMQNVSTHTIGFFQPTSPAAGIAAPQVEILDASGHAVFPPAMPYFPPLPVPAPVIAPLAAGQSVTRQEYVVLRGARIRASEQFTPTLQPDVRRPLATLSTRPIALTLTAEPAPALMLHTSGSEPAIDVTPPPGLAGSPLVLAYADCGFPNYNYSYSWMPSKLPLTPGCSPVLAWHVRVGWLNHPIAALDYVPAQPAPPAPLPPTPAPSPTPTTTPSPPHPAFNQLLQRAYRAMSSVHALHAAGIHTSSEQSITIAADCRSSAGAGLPITLRSTQSRRPKAAHPYTEGYVITGPVIPQPGTATRARWRSPATGEQWRAVNLWKQWNLDQGFSEPVFGTNPAYTNQSCPDLIRLTYLAVPIPTLSTPPTVLGLTTVDGHRVWHLRQQQWFTFDLFVDASSYRLRRVAFFAHPGSPTGWEVRFDYSRFNEPVARMPTMASSGPG